MKGSYFCFVVSSLRGGVVTLIGFRVEWQQSSLQR
jgi:hypothetical protein